MLNSKKAAALAGTLGGIALAGAGIAHAAAADQNDPIGQARPGEQPRVVCTHDAHWNVECSQHLDRTWTSDDGSRVVVRQSRSCDSFSRNRRIGPPEQADGGRLAQGAHIDCSNTMPG